MKNIKGIYLIIIVNITYIILFPCVMFSQQYWLAQSSPTAKNLYRSSFPDSVNGWVSGDSGVIIHTSNSGINWIVQNTGINSHIYDIFFINEQKGWALSNDVSYNSTLVLKTTDGGNNWTTFFFPDTNSILMTVYFLDPLKGFMGGFGGIIYTTTNGGLNWFINSSLSGNCNSLAIRRFNFLTPYYGFASGGIIDLAGGVWKTTDGGLNWLAQCVAPEPIYDIKYKDSLFILAMGGDVEYGMSRIYTTNAGVNWLYQELGFFGFVESFDFRTPSELWASGGFSLRVAVSTNFGLNWIDMSAPDSKAINEIRFLSPTLGWAFGTHGAVYKYNTEVIGIMKIETQVPEGFKLEQNFPNPFNSVTSFKFRVPSISYVKLIIYDILGHEIIKLVNERLSSGTYKIDFNAENLASGIYYYRMTTEYFCETKKLVLLK